MRNIVNVLLTILAFLLLDLTIEGCISSNKGENITYSKLITSLENNEVDEIVIKESFMIAEVTMQDAEKVWTNIPSIDNLTNLVAENVKNGGKVTFSIDNAKGFPELLKLVIHVICIILAIILIVEVIMCMVSIKRDGYDSTYIKFWVTSSLIEKINSNTNFSSFVVPEDKKIEIKKLVRYIKRLKKHSQRNKIFSKGIMLVGPDGTGKEQFVKAIAGETKLPIYKVDASFWDEEDDNDAIYKINILFRNAKKRRSIIYLSEMESILIQGQYSEDYRKQLLNKLLEEIDNLCDNGRNIVIGAINYNNVPRKPFTKRGRLDYEISFSLPNIFAREKILEIQAKSKCLSNDVLLDDLAEKCEGFSGNELKSVLDTAEKIAHSRCADFIEQTDINRAFEKEYSKLQTIQRMNYECAIHEAGHAIVGTVLLPFDEITEISIIESEGYGGYNLFYFESKKIKQRQDLINRMAVQYGGKAAEEVILHQLTTGPLEDLKEASIIAYEMVQSYAMGETLLTNVGDLEYDDLLKQNTLETAEKICQEAYSLAKEIITQNQNVLKELGKVLIEKRIIGNEEVRDFMLKNDVLPVSSES